MDMTEQQQTQELERPEPDELARTWGKRIASARKHWEKFHKRCRANRKTVAGFDWSKDPGANDFYTKRANLIHGTITSILPNIYARNPEISAQPTHRAQNLKLFCQTLETVTNRHLEQADLKGRAKASVRSALTTSFGAVKVMYQRDIRKDPIIQSRINDTQDNILQIEALITEIEDPEQRGSLESKREELKQLLDSLNEKVEVTASEGLVIDRVLTDNLLIDPSVVEFFDYRDADWIAQIVPMKKDRAEAVYKKRLAGAKSYVEGASMGGGGSDDRRLASGNSDDGDGDKQIAIIEIWDKVTQRVYTMAEGCDFWLRDPYSPTGVGERWYPFFLLPFQLVDGQFVGPSLVDLTEKLQAEHNEARDKYNQHRDLCKPGWVAGGDISEKSIKRYTDSEIGEITIIDTEGKPLAQVIQPRQHPAIDPAVYDTAPVRYDWEQVTGMQDAARSTVVRPKTATEASIMQQSLSGRVSEFRDQVEDWLQEISQYAAQILLMELTPPQVERIMGPHGVKMISAGGQEIQVEDRSYDWPEMSREEVFDMVEMKIRAGTTGAPDKLEAQENWIKVQPLIADLILKIVELQARGADAEPMINLLRETLRRFDERLEVDSFIPKPPAPQPQMPPQAAVPPQIPQQQPAMIG